MIKKLIPWPINGQRGLAAMCIWPLNSEFVCSYYVDVGFDNLEESIFVSCNTWRKDDSLWVISALALPKTKMNSIKCLGTVCPKIIKI